MAEFEELNKHFKGERPKCAVCRVRDAVVATKKGLPVCQVCIDKPPRKSKELKEKEAKEKHGGK